MGIFDFVSKKFSDKEKDTSYEKKGQEFWESVFSRSVDYEIIETEDGDFFFITDDFNIPHDSGSKFDSITTAGEGRWGYYHSVIQVEELTRRKEHPKKLTFVICPFMVKNNHNFSRILGSFLATCEIGKRKSVFLIGRNAFSDAVAKGHPAREIIADPYNLVPKGFTEFESYFDMVAAAYYDVINLKNLLPKDRVPFCLYCRKE